MTHTERVTTFLAARNLTMDVASKLPLEQRTALVVYQLLKPEVL